MGVERIIDKRTHELGAVLWLVEYGPSMPAGWSAHSFSSTISDRSNWHRHPA